MGLRIKGFIAKSLEEEHKRLEPEGQDLRVAEINFFFKNTPLIDMLKARATAINGKNWNKVKQINQNMTDEVQKDPEAICTPIGAFVTFHDEYSYNAMESKNSIELGGSDSKLTSAPEPTNIIWENLGFDIKRRFTSIVIMIVISLVIVICSFSLMKNASNRVSYILDKYDASVPCEKLFKFYGADRAEELAADEFLYHAKLEEIDEDPDDGV